MQLQHLTLAVSRAPAFRAICSLQGTPRSIGLTDPAKPVTIAALALDHPGPTVVIAPNATVATTLIEELPAWLGPELHVLPFPESGVLPYERQPVPRSIVRDRLRVIAALHTGERAVIVASARSAARRTIAPERFVSLSLERGSRLSQDEFLRQLQSLGYDVEPLADRAGVVARRGGIVDVCPPEGPPVRIEWLGNEIESLRAFDPLTQRSGGPAERASFTPADEAFAAFENSAAAPLRRLDLSGLSSGVRERFEDEIARVGQGEDVDTFFARFVQTSTLLHHVPDFALLIVDEPADAAAAMGEAVARAEAARAEMEAAGDLPRGLPLPFAAWDELAGQMEARPRTELARWVTGEAADTARVPFGVPPTFGGQWRTLVGEAIAMAKRGNAVAIASQQAPRLREMLREAGVEPAGAGSPPLSGRIIVAAGTLLGGWTLPDVAEGSPLVLLTDTEVFGFRKQRKPLPRREEGAHPALLSELEPGDFVVHIEHGIGRFAGLVKRTIDGIEREYLELSYAEADRLFVPVVQIDRINRYVGPGDHSPVLTRLNSGDWRATRERVRRAVTELAGELLELYAGRELVKGHAFSPDTPWQQEMEASFPYIETPDQVEAIRAVKTDMERERPMDRLVCGDVGYGKTEIAVRAAFKAVMDGMQVAVLVPTTVLAQQHLMTFMSRLEGFPIRVEALSRFRSEREQRRIVADLADGSIDIIIGTHRLLQKDVSFKNLGLVIIDEEQRFGVGHKERLKRMRREVDVLTLTATPIPRTLHMALAGIRDMSLIQTPPEARQPIRTYVAEYDRRLVREAIQRERERGGQVYFVHNRVQSIGYIASELRKTIPEAAILVGHGQMHEDELERVMLAFAAGEADVLVCTTIIESGIDIPNVNTIVINNADKLGLAQMYQLRGRVGRSAARAYAYLLYEKGKVLSQVGRRRLEAVFEATELGAGYQIALRDLEIRGAGNLLGAEQSGHIGAVGFDLYTRLLAEAVERLRAIRAGEPPPAPLPSTDISLDLPLAAYLPERYVEDLPVRLALYRRLADVRSMAEAADLARELRDRFGPLPPSAQQLVYVAGLRAAAQAAAVSGVARDDGTLVIRLSDIAVERLTRERRAALDRATPRGVRIGPSQIRLDLALLGEAWQGVLLDVMERLAPEPQHALAR